MYVAGETLPNEEIPVKVFDKSGTSHRYESGGIHGIERVDEFHRIEIVWIGTKEKVLKCAEELHALNNIHTLFIYLFAYTYYMTCQT